ncbi:MAG TPA: hypothetical protein VLD16_13980 [Gaiellaceae bacterium]|nr:hypothetical protein [Gaiellaceae bacterium]
MPPSDDERRCPRCEMPYAEGQEYCLECGERLPAYPGLRTRLGTRWRRRVGWYPGDWIWPTLLALAVAVVAGVASALWLADTSSSAGNTLVRTDAGPTTPPPTQTAPEPTLPTTTATTGTTAAPRPKPKPSATVIAWPSGRAGWTIVLDSVPATNGRAGALAEAKQASRLGLSQVGVIDSAQFSSLHPGYFVVFAGVYATEAAAQSHIIDAHRRGYREPYPRRIVP